MSEWIDELTRGLQAEYGSGPRLCMLGTVDKNGSPRVRSIVCRKIAPDGSIWFASDARSEKNEQLKASPQAEACFYLGGTREQFRVGGSVKLLGVAGNEPARLEIWRGLSDAGRAFYFWPTPGAKRLDPPESFVKEVEALRPAPQSFEVIVLRPRRVEHLQLSQHPHRRRRWMLAGNWSTAAEVNP